MASRKNLKKYVNYISGELFTECIINSLYVPGTNKEKADQLMAKVLETQQDFINRISHTQPGDSKKYYKKFRTDFNACVNNLIEEISALN